MKKIITLLLLFITLFSCQSPDENKNSQKQLTLMTCWPPGTTLKRLIVIATPKND